LINWGCDLDNNFFHNNFIEYGKSPCPVVDIKNIHKLLSLLLNYYISLKLINLFNIILLLFTKTNYLLKSYDVPVYVPYTIFTFILLLLYTLTYYSYYLYISLYQLLLTIYQLYKLIIKYIFISYINPL
jgi:hypothetical protein